MTTSHDQGSLLTRDLDGRRILVPSDAAGIRPDGSVTNLYVSGKDGASGQVKLSLEMVDTPILPLAGSVIVPFDANRQGYDANADRLYKSGLYRVKAEAAAPATLKIPQFAANPATPNSILAWVDTNAHPLEVMLIPHVKPAKRRSPWPMGDDLSL